MNIDHYSNITRLLRVTAYVVRFIKNIKTKDQSERNLEDLRADELKEAEVLWVKSIQSSAFVDELSFLNRKQGMATPPIRVTQFGLFLSEDQIVRCKGRIGNSSLQISTKFPILLPAKHAFVSLLVKRTHDRVRHSGINATLNAVRERFWILRGRETVKRILKHCVVCRRYDAVPCEPSKLPSNRVSDDPPF